VSPPQRKGFGTALLQSTMGKAANEYAPEGRSCVRLENIVAPSAMRPSLMTALMVIVGIALIGTVSLLRAIRC
jgi:hypothetical protein